MYQQAAREQRDAAGDYRASGLAQNPFGSQAQARTRVEDAMNNPNIPPEERGERAELMMRNYNAQGRFAPQQYALANNAMTDSQRFNNISQLANAKYDQATNIPRQLRPNPKRPRIPNSRIRP